MVCQGSAYRRICGTAGRCGWWIILLARAHCGDAGPRPGAPRRASGPNVRPFSRQLANVDIREEFDHWGIDGVIGAGSANLRTKAKLKTLSWSCGRRPTRVLTLSPSFGLHLRAPAGRGPPERHARQRHRVRLPLFKLVDSLGTDARYSDHYSSCRPASDENKKDRICRRQPKSTCPDDLDNS